MRDNETYEEYAEKRDRAQRGLSEKDQEGPSSNITSFAIGIVVISFTLVIMIYMLSVIQAAIGPGTAAYNVTEGLNTFFINYDFIGTMFPIIGVLVVISMIFGIFGIGYSRQDEEEKIVRTENNPKPHRQTYLEYVKEQLAVERMMR